MPAGRPSTYDPLYCDRVVEYGKLGKSRVWIASEIGVAKQTLSNWEKDHPEFLDSMALASTFAQRWWEDAGQEGLTADKFAASVWSRSMAARFPEDWREKQLVGSDPENPLPTGFVVNLVKNDSQTG